MSDMFRIVVSSPPDRERLVAEVWFGGEMVVEINQESDQLRVEIYARESGEPWAVPFAEFIDALNQAKRRLVGPE